MESVIFNLNNDKLFDKLTELFEPNQNITIGEIKTNTFSDGEVSAYLKTSVRGKRVFLMAPIHHHFQKKGWPETKIVLRFWVLSLGFALIGLATLKIR